MGNLLTDIKLKRNLGIYDKNYKEIGDVGWTLHIPLTTIVELSMKVTICKRYDDCKDQNLPFMCIVWCT